MSDTRKTLGKGEFKTLGLSSLGGALEFYDFIIFVFFTQYISMHFFPSDLSAFWKDLNTYGTFAAGYLARPIGGIIMGHFGDRLGRKNMFMLSILLMVVPTFSLALIPTYESIGYLAPLFLLLVRIFQGIAIGGELPGAWVFVREHAPEHQSSLYLAVLTASVVGGILLGNLVALVLNLILSVEQMRDWGWRIPFFIGGVFGIISIYLRKFLSETPVFQQMKQDKNLEKFPLKEVLKTSKKGVILSMFSTWVLAGCIVVLVLFMPNFIQKVFALSGVQKSLVQMAGIISLVFGCVIAGRFADKYGIAKGYKLFALLLALLSALFFYYLYASHNQAMAVIFYILTCFSVAIMVFTPIVMCEVFEAKFRFSGISFAYNIGYAIVGSFTPQLALALHAYASQTQGVGAFALYGYILVLCIVAYGVACAYKALWEK